MIYRQGDVLIQRIDQEPHGLTPVARDAGRIVLAYGEATGHAHAILDRDCALLTADVLTETERILRVGTGGATVVHEEHGPIVLEPGVYRVIRQVEWSDAMEPVLVRD